MKKIVERLLPRWSRACFFQSRSGSRSQSSPRSTRAERSRPGRAGASRCSAPRRRIPSQSSSKSSEGIVSLLSLSLFRTSVELETEINRSGREIDESQHGHGHRYHSLVPRSRIPRARVQVNRLLFLLFPFFSIDLDPVPRGKRGEQVFIQVVFPLAEPVAGAKPKFPMTENSRTLTTYTVSRDQPLTLPCPAQAFPVPAFR